MHTPGQHRELININWLTGEVRHFECKAQRLLTGNLSGTPVGRTKQNKAKRNKKAAPEGAAFQLRRLRPLSPRVLGLATTDRAETEQRSAEDGEGRRLRNRGGIRRPGELAGDVRAVRLEAG